MSVNGPIDHPLDLISSYAAGLLNESDARAVSRHLGECKSCRDELGSIRSLKASMPEGLPGRINDAVWSRVDLTKARRGGWAEGVRTMWGHLSLSERKDAGQMASFKKEWMGAAVAAAVGASALVSANPDLARQVLVRGFITGSPNNETYDSGFYYYRDTDQAVKYGFSYYWSLDFTSSGGSPYAGYGYRQMYPYSEPASGGGSSNPDNSSSSVSSVAKPSVPVAASVVLLPLPGHPGIDLGLSAAEAKSLQAGLSGAPAAALASFTSALGRLDVATARAVLRLLAVVPADQVSKMIGVVASLPADQADAVLRTMSSLPASQVAALLGTTATLPSDVASKVFSQLAALGASGASVSVAVPGAVSKGANGVDAVSFDLDGGAVAFSNVIGDAEVAGVSNAAANRVVLLLAKPGQQARVKRPRTGVWPTLATPVTSGAQAGLTPWISVPADATDFWFEPAPSTANEVQRGSLGGGSVIPLGAPFSVTVAGNKSSSVAFSLPSITVAPNLEFGYLAQASDSSGAFIGYIRADAKFVPSSGRQEFSVGVGDLSGAFMLPAAFQPAYVQNFGADLQIYSGWDDKAASFGPAGPQFTTFRVVAPQIGKRIYVFNPVTDNYGWIDAEGVGPAGPPK